jgi:transcriptional regulator with XRE-family HTH domain
MDAVDYTNTLPIGKKIEKVRRLRRMTQSDLGEALGISKQAVSKIERTEQMDDERLNEIAKALDVNADTIKNFSEQTAINIVSSTLHDNAGSVFYNPTFYPIDKVVELYERMLKEKDELIEKLMQ